MKTQTEKITQKVENEKSIKDNLEIIHSLNNTKKGPMKINFLWSFFYYFA